MRMESGRQSESERGHGCTCRGGQALEQTPGFPFHRHSSSRSHRFLKDVIAKSPPRLSPEWELAYLLVCCRPEGCYRGYGSLSVLWWDKSSFNSEDKWQVMSRWPRTHRRVLVHAVWVSTKHQTVSPHKGHEKKSRGITRVVPPTALPPVSPPPSPPPPALSFLPPWCSIFCWEAFFGNGKGSGIVFWDQ